MSDQIKCISCGELFPKKGFPMHLKACMKKRNLQSTPDVQEKVQNNTLSAQVDLSRQKSPVDLQPLNAPVSSETKTEVVRFILEQLEDKQIQDRSKCLKCNATTNNANFCSECGEQLVTQAYCKESLVLTVQNYSYYTFLILLFIAAYYVKEYYASFEVDRGFSIFNFACELCGQLWDSFFMMVDGLWRAFKGLGYLLWTFVIAVNPNEGLLLKLDRISCHTQHAIGYVLGL